MNPRSLDHTYFDMDGRGLQEAFLELGPDPIMELLEREGLTWDDFDLVAIHQVALPYLPPILDRLGVAPDKTVVTIADHGNLASATLPLEARGRRAIAGWSAREPSCCWSAWQVASAWDSWWCGCERSR